MTSNELLTVSNLTVDLLTARTAVRPVDGVSYSLNRGETLAIVGESGSGKTVMNFAPLGLLPIGVEADMSGSVRFDGQELVGAAPDAIKALRGKSIGFIFQDPMSALNPARSIGRQIGEMAELHLGMSRSAADRHALDLIKLVGISDPSARMKQYPHELSGGLRQRVMIAIAIAAEPKLLIADEPTTALDVTVQAQILQLLKDLKKRLNMAMVLITHDMGVVAGSGDRMVVMYAGRAAEVGPVERVLTEPRHPYTMGLINAIPRRTDPVGSAFRGLPGVPPVLGRPIEGCGFAPRCKFVLPDCSTKRPPLAGTIDPSILAACPVVNV
ncbi:ABC transporter ATP-binding protein [Pararhizobium sp.]|uniref:ABC transporter ATP-binding protein n=1 Tax=Pararhizobium sp. TaxID=1977563 RepID=UPI00271C47A2|nr:ABC transporter ATP-binding protein [Pararhizobium sp.]MDO9415522.1 ABC transporter ATP-binding protein [Pararhizobium sp.]